MKAEATVTLGPLEDMRVRYEYEPGRPGRMYMNNGDPGYPDEPAELYITEVLVRGKWLPAHAFDAVDWIEQAELELLERDDLSTSEDAARWDRDVEAA